MLKLKLQYFGHLMRKTDLLEKTLMMGKKAGGEGDERGWDGLMVSLTQWTWDWASSGRWWWTGKPGVLQSMGLQRVRHEWATELNNGLLYLNVTYFICTFLYCWTSKLFLVSCEYHHIVECSQIYFKVLKFPKNQSNQFETELKAKSWPKDLRSCHVSG